MGIGIRAIEYALPDVVVTNEQLVERHGFEHSFLREKLGIFERRRVSQDQAVSHMAITAGETLLSRHGIATDDIGLLVLVTQTADYCMPHTAALVQDGLGLGKHVATFDMSLGCSGFVYGLASATAFMEAHGIENGLLITAETHSRLVDPADRSTAPLFGDAACATLLSHSPVYEAGRFCFATDGSGHELLIARGTGARPGEREHLRMDGREIFRFAMMEVPPQIEACLQDNGLSKDEIDCWVFHQAGKFMLEELARRCKVPLAKVVVDMSDVGNTTSSTIPIALRRRVLVQESMPDRVLISGFGVGLSWATTVLTLREDPDDKEGESEE